MDRYPTTSDLVTMCLLLASEPRERMRAESPCSLTEYRLLSRVCSGSGETMTQMGKALGVSSPTVSLAVKSLAKLGFLETNRGKGNSVALKITKRGELSLRLCERVLSETYRDLFEACGDARLEVMGVGHMASAISLGSASYKAHGPDFDVACLETYLACEHNITKHTHSFGFTTSEFRILFRLLERGPKMTFVALSSDLLLVRSTVSEACASLVERGLVEVGMLDGKRRSARITPLGLDATHRVGDAVDESLTYGIRNSDPKERMVFLASAEAIVREKRRRRTLSSRTPA